MEPLSRHSRGKRGWLSETVEGPVGEGKKRMKPRIVEEGEERETNKRIECEPPPLPPSGRAQGSSKFASSIHTVTPRPLSPNGMSMGVTSSIASLIPEERRKLKEEM